MTPPLGKSENKESSWNIRNEETDLTETRRIKTHDDAVTNSISHIVSWARAFVKENRRGGEKKGKRSVQKATSWEMNRLAATRRGARDQRAPLRVAAKRLPDQSVRSKVLFFSVLVSHVRGVVSAVAYFAGITTFLGWLAVS